LQQTGTGIGAIFYPASRAIGCALHIQHVIAKRNAVNLNDAVRVRVGLHAGEAIVEEDDNDSFGVSIERARQISAWAEAGQVLASDVVRQLVSVKGIKFEPAGLKRLKGFDGQVALYKFGPG
jgi:adenylate cyclase